MKKASHNDVRFGSLASDSTRKLRTRMTAVWPNLGSLWRRWRKVVLYMYHLDSVSSFEDKHMQKSRLFHYGVKHQVVDIQQTEPGTWSVDGQIVSSAGRAQTTSQWDLTPIVTRDGDSVALPRNTVLLSDVMESVEDAGQMSLWSADSTSERYNKTTSAIDHRLSHSQSDLVTLAARFPVSANALASRRPVPLPPQFHPPRS